MAKPFKWNLRPAPKTDPQQFLLYRMENEAIGARCYIRMTCPAIRKLCRAVTRAYGIKPVTVRFTGERLWAAVYEDGKITIHGKKTSRDFLTVLHELAHHLHDTLTNGAGGHQDHGPEFLACYMSILDTARFIPIDAMKVICRRYGIKFIDPGTTSSIRKLQKAITRKK